MAIGPPSADCSWSSSSRSRSNRGAAPGRRPAPTPSPYKPPTTAVPGSRAVAPVAASARTARSRSGPAPREADWSIRTSTARVTAVPSVGLAEPTDIASGPVVDLGPADDLDVIVISGPSRCRAGHDPAMAIRRRGRPERLDLARLAVAVAGRRRHGPSACARPAPRPARSPAGSRASTGWTCSSSRPGAIRMVMLSARGDGDAVNGDRRGAPVPGDGTACPSTPSARPSCAACPRRPTCGPSARSSPGWARPPAAGDCRVAQIWRPAGRRQAAGRSRSARRAPSG